MIVMRPQFPEGEILPAAPRLRRLVPLAAGGAFLFVLTDHRWLDVASWGAVVLSIVILTWKYNSFWAGVLASITAALFHWWGFRIADLVPDELHFFHDVSWEDGRYILEALLMFSVPACVVVVIRKLPRWVVDKCGYYKEQHGQAG